ncbi:M28 family peptidase [Paucihalobacter ruber]|uniref:Vacuolar membrane protease n=1 Tax=Paucihalobacter ruber TaxID=2567861 RepID=A0A506PRD1_9FLAO|nr:M28 family peptidase [Paucihalobacter ruber]TPV34780.1 M28 family peptidase [Paucihalobacter ruber]
MIKKLAPVLLLVVAVFWSYRSLIPSTISNLNTPETEFSTERALKHLKVISAEPHYPGTEAHNTVRDYIISELKNLGLSVHIQEGYSYSKKGSNLTQVKNIVAKLQGTSGDKALVLATHYDSNPHSSLGASDAGAGVVTILEGLRAYLKSGNLPTNDVIVLITDAEETGLHGANLFVNKHAWSNQVGLVLNFEARGSGGPSYFLIETNNGNKKLIEALDHAGVKFPTGNSLAYSIYKMLPNDTDLTRFREDGNIDGFNFAFIDDHYDYHTVLDNYDRLDKNSLEHQGTYLMPLLAYFSNANLNEFTSYKDHVYFSMPLFNLVYYPFSWIIPILVLTILLFLLLVYIGIKKHHLSNKEIGLGFIPAIMSIAISALFAFIGWQLIGKIYPQYNEILHGFTYNGHDYIWAFTFLSLAISLLTYSWFYKPENAGSLMVAPILLWLLIAAAAAFKLKGASYFIIPVIFALGTLAIFTRQRQPNLILLSLLSFPAIFITAPLVQMLPVGLGLKMLVASAIIVSMLFTLFIGIFGFVKHKKRWSALSLIIGLFFFAKAHNNSNFTVENPKPNSLIYYYNADANEAQWLTYDRVTDEWTEKYLTINPTPVDANNSIFNSKYKTGFTYFNPTKVKSEILPPVINKITDTVIGDLRYLKYFLSPQTEVNRYELFANTNVTFTSFKINGTELNASENPYFKNRKINRLLTYFVSEDKFLDLEFTIPANQETSIDIYESSFDLLTSKLFKLEPRKDWMIPKPFVLNDAIMIKKTLKVE